MDFEVRVCSPGEKWFPWNYGRRTGTSRKRAGLQVVPDEPGLVVLNAVSASGRVLGSCSMRIGYRHSPYLLGDEEYQHGVLGSGPAYFWAADDSPWIMTLKSFWVRPECRRQGIARAFAERARAMGLPTYLAFANSNMERWFDAEFRPSRRKSRLQKKIYRALNTEIPDSFRQLESAPMFHVHLLAEASAGFLFSSAHGADGPFSLVDLADVLVFPSRIDEWQADDGDSYEAGFSDSAFANDRCFGCLLEPELDSWGPTRSPFDDVSDDDDVDLALAEFDRLSTFTAGIVSVRVVDPDALLANATVRRFLRTLEWREFESVVDAVEELYVTDLSEMPRGLRRFAAVVEPD